MISSKKIGGFFIFWFGFFFTIAAALFVYYVGTWYNRWIILVFLGIYTMIYGLYRMAGSKI